MKIPSKTSRFHVSFDSGTNRSPFEPYFSGTPSGTYANSSYQSQVPCQLRLRYKQVPQSRSSFGSCRRLTAIRLGTARHQAKCAGGRRSAPQALSNIFTRTVSREGVASIRSPLDVCGTGDCDCDRLTAQVPQAQRLALSKVQRATSQNTQQTAGDSSSLSTIGVPLVVVKFRARHGLSGGVTECCFDADLHRGTC